MTNPNHFKVEPEDSSFKLVFADVTHRCNMACKNCYLPNRKIPDMDPSKLYDVLRRLPKSVDVRLIGAEPTMREDIFEIIRTVLKLGHRTSLVTNGLKLADLDYCIELKKAGLRIINISMNGADDDQLYELVDGGRYAERKVRAFKNALELGFRVGTGTIISKGMNESAVRKMVDLTVRTATSLGLRFPKRGFAPLLRFKNVGAIGRYSSSGLMAFDALITLIASELGISEKELLGNESARGTIYVRSKSEAQRHQYRFSDTPRSFYWPLQTEVGQIMVLINDWSADEYGVPDGGNLERGRVTQDWKLAPFFEDVKLNEFQY